MHPLSILLLILFLMYSIKLLIKTQLINLINIIILYYYKLLWILLMIRYIKYTNTASRFIDCNFFIFDYFEFILFLYVFFTLQHLAHSRMDSIESV